MIIIDLNQVMIANMMAQLGNHTNASINEDLLRHMVLNSIRNYRNKFVEEYGEIVIACDGKNTWRRGFFPYYKAHRRKFREESEMDWNLIFQSLNNIREELRDNFPYKYIHVEGAEADDVIGTICHTHGTQLGKNDPILILSGDKDFIQLQVYSNVEQFDPIRKRWLKHNNPANYLLEHIIKGDRGDGVPNMLSKDDCLINSRQKPCRQKFIDALTKQFSNVYDYSDLSNVDFTNDEYARNFNRNMHLVDLRMTPDDIKLNILEQFAQEAIGKRSNLFNYFIEKRLKGLVESIGDF
jgi:hypothetical protein